MKGISTLFFRNRYLLVLTIVVLAVSGAAGVLSLPVTEDPLIVRRNPIVVTVMPGASAERVEAQVTEKIEAALQEVPEIKTVSSTSRAGVSVVSIDLLEQVVAGENERVFSVIRDQLAEAQRQFPAEASAPVLEDKRGAVAYTLLVGFTWAGEGEPELGVMRRHAEALADRLRTVPDAQVVEVFGAPEEELTVTVEPETFALLGLTAGDVARAAAAADAKVPAGVFRGPGTALGVEVAGELGSAARVRDVPLLRGDDGEVVRVGDVAEVARGVREPPGQIATVDGRRTVLVASRMGRGGRVTDFADASAEVIEAYRPLVGGGVELEVVFDQSTYTRERLRMLVGNLVMGAIIVVAVIFVFMGWRSSLVVGSALPLVASAVLLMLIVLGGSLHQMSIFGMIIALGLLIDNAIVVTDEVNQHLAAGESRLESVRSVVRTYAAPLAASTLTTVLAFAPIPLLPGSAGDFVGDIGMSVILAVIASLLISMTVIVSLAGLFGEAGRPRGGAVGRFLRHGVQSDRVTRAYRGLLRGVVAYPAVALLAAVTPPAVGFLVGSALGSSFFPPASRDMFDLKLFLPQEASIEATAATAAEVEAFLLAEPDVERVDWLVGASYPSVYYNLVMNQDNSPHFAQAVVHTSSAAATEGLVPRLQRELSDAFPEARVITDKFGQGPPVSAGVEFRIAGPDLNVLRDLGEDLRRRLQAHPDVTHAAVTLPRGTPKLWLDADEDAATLAGLRLTDLSEQLRGNLDGAVGGSVLEGLEELPVRVRQPAGDRGDTSAVASTRFALAATGDGPAEFVPLEAVGSLALRPADAGIAHYDGLRVNTVEGYTRVDALPIDIADEVLAAARADGFELPLGYTLELGGEAESSGDATGNLAASAPTLVTIMLATLVLTFRSVRMAGLLLAIAACCVGLSLLSTFALSLPIGFNTILGTLGLIGISLNDSIVVLSAIRNDPDARAGDREAVVRVVISCTRHVLSTTLTTVGGFAPLLLLSDGDFWPSLAVVLAGGIVGATVLALIFIPAAYVLVHPRKFGLLPAMAGKPRGSRGVAGV